MTCLIFANHCPCDVQKGEGLFYPHFSTRSGFIFPQCEISWREPHQIIASPERSTSFTRSIGSSTNIESALGQTSERVPCMLHFDSMGSHPTSSIAQVVRHILLDTWEAKVESSASSSVHRDVAVSNEIRSMPCVKAKSPQQPDGISCALYHLTNSENIIIQRPSITQRDLETEPPCHRFFSKTSYQFEAAAVLVPLKLPHTSIIDFCNSYYSLQSGKTRPNKDTFEGNGTNAICSAWNQSWICFSFRIANMIIIGPLLASCY